MLIFNISDKDRLVTAPRIWEWQKLQPKKSGILDFISYDWQFYRSYSEIEDALNDLHGLEIKFTQQQMTLDAIKEIKILVAKLDDSLKKTNMNGDL
jgi:hypothetical protein